MPWFPCTKEFWTPTDKLCCSKLLPKCFSNTLFVLAEMLWICPFLITVALFSHLETSHSHSSLLWVHSHSQKAWWILKPCNLGMPFPALSYQNCIGSFSGSRLEQVCSLMGRVWSQKWHDQYNGQFFVRVEVNRTIHLIMVRGSVASPIAATHASTGL